MLKKYQSLVNEAIPVTRYMQWTIEQLAEQSISTKTLLEPNINVHGTGYAGSIYSAAMATGWTLLKYWYDERQFKTQLVAAEANIKYLSPINADFYCYANIDTQTAEYSNLLNRMRDQKSCGFVQEVEVLCDSKICATVAIQFVFKCKG